MLKWATALFVLLIGPVDGLSAERETIRIATFPSYGKNAGLLFAQDAGLFAAQDLLTEIIDTRQNVYNLTEGRQADIAQALCSTVSTINARGGDYVVIAVRDQKNPIATVSLTRSGISSPADLNNKRWGYTAAFSPEQYLFVAVGRQLGFNSDSIEKVDLGLQNRLPALLDGTVDFISAWVGSVLPSAQEALMKAGQEAIVLRWADYGVDIYGECWVAKASYVRTHAETVLRWKAALSSGYEHVRRKPEDGVKAIMRRYGAESMSEAVAYRAVTQGNELLGVEGTKPLLAPSCEKLSRTFSMLGAATVKPIKDYVWPADCPH